MKNNVKSEVISKPRHKLHSSQKTEKDYFDPTAQYYIRNSNFNSEFHTELDLLHRAAQGEIDSSHTNYVLNPTNTKNADLTRYPARLRHFDIIGPILELFLGEFTRRPNNPTVVSANEDSANKYKEEKLKAMGMIIAQDYVNNLNSLGFDTGVDTKPVTSYQEASKSFDNTYEDAAANVGQEALNYLMYQLRMDVKHQQMLYDWLVTGCILTYKDVYMDDVTYEVVDMRYATVFDLPENGLVEDATAVVYKKNMSRSEIIDEYNEELSSKKDDDGNSYLDMVLSEEFGRDGSYVQSVMHSPIATNADIERLYSVNESVIPVYVVNWQGMEKVGTLTYIDPVSGQITTKEVDDTYILNKKYGDIDIQWEWINCAYITHVINGDFSVRTGKALVQRNELNNNARNTISFNGTIRGYRRNTIKSVVKTGLNYNILYDILHFRFELTLAKYRNAMTAFPVGLIPKKDEWDEEKWLYWGTVMDFLFYDESVPGAAAAVQGIKEVGSGSIGRYVLEMWNLLPQVKYEFWEEVGVNRQRYGETQTSDGKGVNDQALLQSNLITEDMFFQLDKFLESDYTGLIDYSKVAWIDGKKGMYYLSNGSRAFLDLEGTQLLMADVGVFVSNSREDADNLKMAKNNVHTLLQNGLPPDAAMKIIPAKNFSGMEKIVNKAMEAERELNAAMEAQKNESAERIQASISEDKQRESGDKRYTSDMNYQATVDAAKIRAGVDLNKIYNDALAMRQDLAAEVGEENMSAFDARIDKVKNDIEQQKLDLQRQALGAKAHSDSMKLKVARENRNKYDKS